MKTAPWIERKICHAGHHANERLGFDGSGRQSGAALGATAGKDLTSALGGHACPETMIALSAQITRLEGALHRSALRSGSGPRLTVWPMDKRAEILSRRGADVKMAYPEARVYQPVDNPPEPV